MLELVCLIVGFIFVPIRRWLPVKRQLSLFFSLNFRTIFWSQISKHLLIEDAWNFHIRSVRECYKHIQWQIHVKCRSFLWYCLCQLPTQVVLSCLNCLCINCYITLHDLHIHNGRGPVQTLWTSFTVFSLHECGFCFCHILWQFVYVIVSICINKFTFIVFSL